MFKSLSFIGNLVLLSLLLTAVKPALAQTCDVIAASSMLEVAKTHLASGEDDQVLTLMNAAQAALSGCGTATAPLETEAADITVTPTAAVAEPTAAVATPAASIPNTTSIAVSPDIDAEKAIVFISFANTSIDSGVIDIYSNLTPEPVVTDLAFGEATGLVPFEAGSITFTGRVAGSGKNGEVLAADNKDFAANSSWVVTMAGLQSKVSLIMEPMSIVRSKYNGQARVRVVNFVQDSRIDLVEGEGDDFGSHLGWVGMKDKMIDPGTHTLQAHSDGKALMEPMTFDFAANTTYTLYIIGQAGSDHPVQILSIVTPQETTRVRFISTRSDAVEIFYRPAKEMLIENIANGETSDWFTLEAGAVTFLAYAPGTGMGGREMGGIALQLRPGRDLTITMSDNNMDVTEVALTPQS